MSYQAYHYTGPHMLIVTKCTNYLDFRVARDLNILCEAIALPLITIRITTAPMPYFNNKLYAYMPRIYLERKFLPQYIMSTVQRVTQTKSFK